MTSGEVTIDVDRQAILRGADRLTAGYGRGVGPLVYAFRAPLVNLVAPGEGRALVEDRAVFGEAVSAGPVVTEVCRVQVNAM